ncbi:MAG: hypothetical protein II642_08580 [Firmicutes bacterium]|nr:hypothetical protein [Bacillota bacterium]
MKEQIYTIPIHDAFNEPGECPFCAMYRKLEDTTVQYVLSPSYMEEDVRGETNRLGFCRTHMDRIYREGNALGVGLMMHSMLKEQHENVFALLKNASAAKKLLQKKNTEASPLEAYRLQFKSDCYICSRIQSTFARYLEAFFSMYKKEAGFKEQVFACKGFCLDHFMLIYDAAGNYLKAADLDEFRNQIAKIEDEHLTRVEDEVEWFTKKFDYRYANEPWKNSKDALPRSIQKINSQFVDKN